jgi:hypothetical protein
MPADHIETLNTPLPKSPPHLDKTSPTRPHNPRKQNKQNTQNTQNTQNNRPAPSSTTDPSTPVESPAAEEEDVDVKPIPSPTTHTRPLVPPAQPVMHLPPPPTATTTTTTTTIDKALIVEGEEEGDKGAPILPHTPTGAAADQPPTPGYFPEQPAPALPPAVQEQQQAAQAAAAAAAAVQQGRTQDSALVASPSAALTGVPTPASSPTLPLPPAVAEQQAAAIRAGNVNVVPAAPLPEEVEEEVGVGSPRPQPPMFGEPVVAVVRECVFVWVGGCVCGWVCGWVRRSGMGGKGEGGGWMGLVWGLELGARCVSTPAGLMCALL